MSYRARTRFEAAGADAEEWWNVKTILAFMPLRWDPHHLVPLNDIALPPPAAMPVDAASPGGLFDLLGTHHGERAFQNPYGDGTLSFSTHQTSAGALTSLCDHTDKSWRASRKTLSSSFLEVELTGAHKFQLSHFAFRRHINDDYDMVRSFEVHHQVLVGEVLVWTLIGRVQCADANQPEPLRWCSPVPIAGDGFSNHFRFVPVSDWSGSTSSRNSRLAFSQFELFGTYRGAYAKGH